LAVDDFTSHPLLKFVNYRLRRHPHTEPGTLLLKIGDEGSFAGKFVAKSVKHEAVAAPCKGEPSVVEEGFFVGDFDFHGADGYTDAHRHRAEGTVIRSTPWVCHGSRNAGPGEDGSVYAESEEEAHELRLIAGRPDGDPRFQANRYEEPTAGESLPPSISFIAGVSRTSHGIEISSDIALLVAKPTAFQVPNLAEPFAEATVAPPAPFSGSATFKLTDPPGSRWSGDLAVELPVFGKVALSGPKLAAGLCARPGHCTKTLPPAMRPDSDGAFTGGFFG
jgi:hypothetical protein